MIITIAMQRNVTGAIQGKWMHTGKILSIAGGVYAVLVLLLAFIPVIFRYRMSGLLLHYQLCAVWLIQMGWLLVCGFMVLKQEGQMTVWMLAASLVVNYMVRKRCSISREKTAA